MANESDTGELIVDASLFMGMHSTDEAVRLGCKAFFVRRLGGQVLMPLEQVGRCDDLVWAQPRTVQDAYYPFMDVLHTDMKIDRFPYQEDDLRRALETPAWSGLPLIDRLTLATAVNRGATVVTVNPRLLATAGPVRTVTGGVPARPGDGTPATHAGTSTPAGSADTGSVVEEEFPAPLEELYRASLVLRLPLEKG